jgi:hypothetical protein
VIDSTLVESGRAILGAPRLSRAERVTRASEDEKFLLGDLIGEVPDDDLEQLAKELGHNLTPHNLKSYRDVAKVWPPENRVAASWTVHRTLKGEARRFEIIQPGMTLREAQIAIGKNPADTEHPSRWPMDRRVPFLISQLQDDKTNHAVRAHLDDQKKARQVRATANAVTDDLRANFRDAQRQLRELRDAKSPETAAYEALFELRKHVEYLRAVGKACTEEDSFIPKSRRPDIVSVIRDTTVLAVEVLAALSPTEPTARDAAADIATRLTQVTGHALGSSFTGTIISGDDDDDPGFVIDGELA